MFLKKENNKKILEKKIDWLIDILERSNLKELIYILGSKKQIIFNNILAGISRGVGIGIRNNYYNSINSILTKQNCHMEYSYNRKIFGRYCRNSRKKQVMNLGTEKKVNGDVLF